MTNNQLCDLLCGIGIFFTWIFALLGICGADWAKFVAFAFVSIVLCAWANYED